MKLGVPFGVQLAFLAVLDFWCVDHGLLPGAGSSLSLTCPHHDVVQALFDGFQTFVRRYEQELARQRYQHAKTRRANNLAYVFQDCKDDPLPKADVLLDRVEIPVEEVREEDSSVVLTGPTPLLDGVPVVIQGAVVDVVAHSEDSYGLNQLMASGLVMFSHRNVLSPQMLRSCNALLKHGGPGGIRLRMCCLANGIKSVDFGSRAPSYGLALCWLDYRVVCSGSQVQEGSCG